MTEPRDVLNAWMTAVNQGDLPAILALYSEQAVLIPTFSSRILDTPEKISRYFENLVQKPDLSLALHEKTLAVQPLQGAICSAHGIYCWRFTIDDELLSFEARFSFLIDPTKARPILHHHTSQIPRTL